MWRPSICPYFYQHLVLSEFFTLSIWCVCGGGMVIYHCSFSKCLECPPCIRHHPRCWGHRGEKDKGPPPPRPRRPRACVPAPKKTNQGERPEGPAGLCGAAAGRRQGLRLGPAQLSRHISSPAGWPILLGLTGIPAALQLLCLPFFPESPRYLLIQKKDEAAAKNGKAFR